MTDSLIRRLNAGDSLSEVLLLSRGIGSPTDKAESLDQIMKWVRADPDHSLEDVRAAFKKLDLRQMCRNTPAAKDRYIDELMFPHMTVSEIGDILWPRLKARQQWSLQHDPEFTPDMLPQRRREDRAWLIRTLLGYGSQDEVARFGIDRRLWDTPEVRIAKNPPKQEKAEEPPKPKRRKRRRRRRGRGRGHDKPPPPPS